VFPAFTLHSILKADFFSPGVVLAVS